MKDILFAMLTCGILFIPSFNSSAASISEEEQLMITCRAVLDTKTNKVPMAAQGYIEELEHNVAMAKVFAYARSIGRLEVMATKYSKKEFNELLDSIVEQENCLEKFLLEMKIDIQREAKKEKENSA